MLKVAQRADVPPFHVMNVLSAAAEQQRIHGNVISLAVGQPSTPAPAAVRAAAITAIEQHNLGYTPQLGLPELRSAIAGHYASQYGLDVSSDEVIVTTGSSGAFLLAFLAAFDVGDRVVLPRPGYPAYRNMLHALGCEVVDLPCHETGFQPTVEQLDALSMPVSGLVIASPANPTGTVLAPDKLASITQWCETHGVQLISDEIYHGIGYGKRLDSAWRTLRTSIVVNSFSKFFSMTGWRLGWLLAPPELRSAADRLTGNFTLCPPAVAQYAAASAFHSDSYAEINGHVARYQHNRELLISGLAKLGIDRLAPPDGAFYVYANISHLTNDSLDFCARVLRETGVAIAPGVDFDPVDGNKFVRLCFAGSADDITEALVRLERWLHQQG